EGELGNVLHVHARVGTYITLMNSGSRYQEYNPGSLFLDYSHQPDMFLWLLGRAPSAISVSAFQGGELELTSNPNVAVIVYEYDSPLIATLHLNYVQMPQCHDYEIVGDRGWAQASFPSGRVTIGRRSDQSVREEILGHGPDDLYRSEHDAFFLAVDSGAAPETSAADGVISTSICEASIEAWRTRRRVACGA
ncbi:MAG: Gfo/Idh/MocA family oxidoreductase, partial [Bryobacteraceae bacterium]